MDIKSANSADLPTQHQGHGLTTNVDLNELPVLIDGCDTLPKLFQKRCAELGERTAHREKEYGIWLSHSWNDFYRHAKFIALGLLSLGLKRGDVISMKGFNLHLVLP